MRPTEEVLEWRRAFVAAVRSGKFTQAFGVLKTAEDCFCFQGVACELFRRETGVGEWSKALFGGYYFKIGDVKQFLWPSEVTHWLGHDENPTVDEAQTGFATANDIERWTFDQLADAYEARYITPFAETENAIAN